MNNTSSTYTLGEVVEQYCIHQFNDKRKNFENMMFFAQATWAELLKKTLWAFSSEWLPVHTGTPYPYVIIPANMERFFGLYYADECNRLIPVERTSVYSVLPKPANKSCECKAKCDCGSNCATVNTMSFTTKPHVIEGITYLEKEWIEVCPNGDLKKWRELPTWDADLEQVTMVEQSEIVCKLDVAECGCVKETPTNTTLLNEHCGCQIVCCNSKLYSPYPASTKTVLQLEGDRIYIIGPDVKEWYFIHYQEGKACRKSAVPDYCLWAVMRGIDFRSKAFNPRVSPNEREQAKRDYNAAKFEILEHLNPIDLEFIFSLENERKKL